MNLFQIDFIMGNTEDALYGDVIHSLTDTATDRKIISLTMPPDKLSSVSNYTREPKRLTFECFPTTWMTDNLLSGENEHERYISYYEVNVYRDNVLIFTGIIDTSQLSIDDATGIVNFMCFDKTKLFSIFSDLTHYYSLTSGYEPIHILGYFLQDIEQTIPISIPYTNALVLPDLFIASGDSISIAKIDYDDMLVVPADINGWSFSLSESVLASPYYGYIVDELANNISFVFALKVAILGEQAGQHKIIKYKYRGKVLKIYNNICPVVAEYEAESDWVPEPETSGLTAESSFQDFMTFFMENEGLLAKLEDPEQSGDKDFMAFFLENGVLESQIPELASTGALGDGHYGSEQAAGDYVRATFYGEVFPAKLKPGESYTTGKEAQTENLKTLQAMLMLYNATIYCNSAGTIILKSKETYGASVTDIADNDVVSMVRRRVNQEVPDTKQIDIFAGDTTALQGIIKTYLLDFFNAKWCANLTIDQLAVYTLGLQGKIRIKNVVYAITEVQLDWVADDYKVVAWQM